MEDSAIERLILVVEDNARQAELIEEALKDSSVRHQVVVVQDGFQAMNFLYQTGKFVDAPRPDLILLDLDVPAKDGRTILAEIKVDPKLRRIPIVVLTHSNHEEDIFKSYELQGNCYVIKSSDFDQLFAIVQRIEEFWLGIVTLPLE